MRRGLRRCVCPTVALRLLTRCETSRSMLSRAGTDDGTHGEHGDDAHRRRGQENGAAWPSVTGPQSNALNGNRERRDEQPEREGQIAMGSPPNRREDLPTEREPPRRQRCCPAPA